MKRFVLFTTLALVFAISAFAGSQPQHMARGGWGTLHGQAINTAKADGDTIYMLGGPDRLDGKFEDIYGNANWQGWTSQDLTYSDVTYWNISTFQAVNGTYSMWCGTDFDGNPGYGDDWNQNLVFTYQVADNSVSSSVVLTGTIRTDSEPGYDFTYVEWNQGGIWNVLQTLDNVQDFALNEAVTYAAADYVGSANDQIQLRIRFSSDGGYSDQDGQYDTNGACQLDDLVVTVDGTIVDSEDFEDQVSDMWLPVLDPGVGDYAALYTNLQDADPCRTNFSPQVAFVDNGVVVPGTGGSPCITWCYGPGGYIVTNTGGVMGPNFHINNIIISPVIDWPAGVDAAYIEFGVFRHEELGAYSTWPGMFYQWHVRSTADPVAYPIEDQAWVNRNFVQYGGPDYTRQNEDVTDLMEVGRTQMQLGLRVIEYGYNWGWEGTDGTPAPYLDNVQIVAYPFAGPGIAARDIDIANDNFPAAGDLDFVDLANNVVRFDAAQNISPQADLVNDPGDSIWFDISAVRTGSVLNDMPKMYVRMKANPVFDGVRVLPANFTQTGNIVEGWVYGDSTFNTNGTPILDRYNFDLPDGPTAGETDAPFFFPGDVIHFYVEAQDNAGGDIGTTLIPGDTTGFASFKHDLQYDSDFIVRALPTMFSATEGDQPTVLLWNDFGDRGGENEWLYALQQLGYAEGADYDVYYTNGPSSGVGNGLGGRATSTLLGGYNTMLYTAGDLSVNLLANGDFDNDPGDDIGVVDAWFARGDKNAFMTGDDLVTGLRDAGANGEAFVNNYFSVNYIEGSILSYIGNQTAPLVVAADGNGIIARVDKWIAYGGCLGINTFDCLEATGTSTKLAGFAAPGTEEDGYSYAAAVYNNNSENNADVVMMPYDFMYLYNAPGWTPPAGYAGIAARAVILEDILDFFGESGLSTPTDVAPDAVLSVNNYPNPFNPTTTIKLNLPKSGQVSVKVYNVRGELVRTLRDESMQAGVYDIIWDGKSDQGSQAASGVYFYETRANGEVKVNKMALVK